MIFEVVESPDANLAVVGELLTVSETAQLLELNAGELVLNSAMAETMEMLGFTLRVIP